VHPAGAVQSIAPAPPVAEPVPQAPPKKHVPATKEEIDALSLAILGKVF